MRARHGSSAATFTRCAALAAAIGTVSAPALAHADRNEAQWSARTFGGIADVAEEGSSRKVTPAGGLSVGMSYGLSNHLDIGAELVTLATAKTAFDGMAIVDGGLPYRAPLNRQSVSTLLLLGPTFRFGVAWVPVLTLAAGGGERFRSAGTFDNGVTLDDKRASKAFEMAALARVGIERRLHRRLTVGLYSQGLASWSPSAALLPVLSFSLGLSYVNYL
jgi:hypothetical protein